MQAMVRLNAILVLVLLGCALAVVSSQHKARALFLELERAQERARALEVEWGQLQLEQSTWAAHVRIERIARDRLQMRTPVAAQLIAVDAGSGPAR